MSGQKTLVVKRKNKIVYSIKVNDEVVWEGENVHEVFPMLRESYRERELSISCETKK